MRRYQFPYVPPPPWAASNALDRYAGAPDRPRPDVPLCADRRPDQSMGIMSPDIASYDSIIVAVSGGKDGTACVLALLEAGGPAERIELWHREVDGAGRAVLHGLALHRPVCRSPGAGFQPAALSLLARGWLRARNAAGQCAYSFGYLRNPLPGSSEQEGRGQRGHAWAFPRSQPAFPCQAGFSRLFCAFCIFGNADQFATLKWMDANRFAKLDRYEKDFGCTIKRDRGLEQLSSEGTVYQEARSRPDLLAACLSDRPALLQS